MHNSAIEPVVIVRAFGGEPLRRVVLETTPTVAFVANPVYLERIKAGDSAPVGMPRSDVFRFDEDVYVQLLNAWRTTGSTPPDAWKALKPWAGE